MRRGILFGSNHPHIHMQLKDIKQTCNEIVDLIDEGGRGLIYRDYETFLKWFGMTQRRNFDLLKKVDYQLKKQNISLWVGKEELRSVSDFQRGQTITFRLSSRSYGEDEYGNQNAGIIKIADDKSGIRLYKHQEDALSSLHDKITRTNRNPFGGLLVLPTGGGKTLTAGYWIAKNLLDKNKKVLWIAHRHELLEQAKATFHERLAFKDIFTKRTSFNYRIISGIHDKPVHIKPTDDIIISSKDSLNAGFNHLYNNWLKGNDEIFLVVDEAHHATAKTYRRLITNLKEKVDEFRMIGLTATPFRTAEDEQGLLAKVFPDDIVYKVDLRTLISRGILSKPIFEEVSTKFDITNYLSDQQLDNLQYFEIDSIGRESARTIAENVTRNRVIVDQYRKHKDKYGQTIVFALNRDNAVALNKLFGEAGIRSEYVLSSIKDMATGVTLSSKENKEVIDRFRNGEIDVLINVNILTEGTDLPKVNSIFLARPTNSSILMTQMIGRGLRGEKAGGTKEAYIVSFVDNWQDKVSWVNPEQLLIEENIDFDDKDAETKKQIVRLVSINKIEEFAVLSDQSIDSATRDELERVSFIERVPLGIYHFSLLRRVTDEEGQTEEREKNCEVLIYDNLKQSYLDFISALPDFFEANEIVDLDDLSDADLANLAAIADYEFFFGCVKHPGYREQDIRDILQYFAQSGVAPKYVELGDREKFNIENIANAIIGQDLGENAQTEMINSLWESNETEWKAFFGFNKKYFVTEIDLARRRIKYPEEYKRSSVIPEEIKELRKLEEMSLQEIREINPEYWKWVSDSVYAKHSDEDGFYYSASGNYKSKNKLDFQIDHVVSRHNGGLTRLDNLQLLTRKENAIAGSRKKESGTARKMANESLDGEQKKLPMPTNRIDVKAVTNGLNKLPAPRSISTKRENGNQLDSIEAFANQANQNIERKVFTDCKAILEAATFKHDGRIYLTRKERRLFSKFAMEKGLGLRGAVKQLNDALAFEVPANPSYKK